MKSEKYMRLAYQLAQKGKGKTSPNPLVGAVIVRDDKIIAKGYHAQCGGDHAEIAAINKAGAKARGATLYVTLEPCSHYGRTPPCVQSIIKSGIVKVVIGMKDPNPLMNGQSVRILQKAGIEVKVGYLVEELARLNEVFIKFMTRRMPFVTAKIAQTLDGKIATSTGESKWITSQEARDYARGRRDEFDAIMVGTKTVQKDNPGLNPKDPKKRLKKIIIDSKLTITPQRKFFQGSELRDIILATTSNAPKTKIDLYKKMGCTVLVAPCKGANGQVDLSWVMKALAKLEISSVLIEGGGRLISAALSDGLVDRMMVYIAPKILGDNEGVQALSGWNIKKLADMISLKDVTVQRIFPDVLIEGYVHRNR
jgi:diaminohydroxyphosphoribosylaminopyrimidine deaminase/5-amino-6-(5-phosphoribosylamino)uracil reductase